MPGKERSLTHTEIVLDLRDDGKLDWHKTFVIFAKTSIKGKTIRGRCYTKIIARPINDGKSFGAYELESVYATPLEVFRYKLENSNEN